MAKNTHERPTAARSRQNAIAGIMKISSSVIRSTTRIKSLSALLILTVLGSSWLVLRADVPQVASGTWAAAGEVVIPSGSVSVALADGRVLVAGGKSDDILSPVISSYDPASGAWVRVGELLTARSGHAMALLNDGRVLIAGGTASYGPTFDIEIFDPANGTSVHAGDMTLARIDHAAATLKDGRVLIVGGSDGVAPLSLAEMFDPATGQSQGVANAMSTARARATATTMIDGHVLVVGGTDGTNDLSSAEIFESATGSFFATGAMQVARSGHVAVLLPNNNQVLVAGGMSAGTAVASAELYADWRDGFSATTPMSAARLGAIAGGLRSHDVAFVAGGGANTGDYYGYATVKTDSDDYWPGEPVTVTGSGWQPGETVVLTISEDADTHYDFIYDAVADEAGNITNSEFAPIQNEVFQHFGKRFYVTARGAASRALNTFTDGNGTIVGTIRNSVTNAVIAGATISCSSTEPNRCNNAVTTNSGTDGAYSLGINFPGNSNTVNITVSAPGYATQMQPLTVNNSQPRTVDWNLVPSAKATPMVTVQPVSVIFDGLAHGTTGTVVGVGGVDLGAATITYNTADGQAPVNAGSYVATGTFAENDNYAAASSTATIVIAKATATVTVQPVSVTFDGQAHGTTGTVAGVNGADLGGATISYDTADGQAPVNVGSYVATGTFAGNDNYAAASSTAAIEIAKKAASVTPAAAGKTYGDADPVLSGTLSGFLAADNVTATYSRTAGETVGAYVISATLAPVAVLGNYDISYNTAGFDIAKKAASVTPAAAGKTYGDADPVLSGTLSGFLAADNVTATYSRTAGETVGAYVISATLAPVTVLGNYDITSNTASFDIAKKAASVTAAAAGKIYGDADPVLSGTLSGFLPADNVTATYSRTEGETVGAYVISATLAPVAVLGNYDITYNTAGFDIAKKTASVTLNPASKTYGDADPALSGTLSGFLAADNVTATYSRAAGETVGTYAISAMLAPVAVLGNYDITSNTASFEITKKAASVTPNAATKIYGGVDPVFTGTLAGFLPADNVTATYSRVAGETVAGNPYTISATLSPADVLGNYAITYNTASFKILYRWDGFLQPINDTAHDVVVMSKFKAGQTIPAKFVLKNADGTVVQQTGMPTFTRTDRLGACDPAAALETPEPVSASVVPQVHLGR